jgi:uncharacterized membrane protein
VSPGRLGEPGTSGGGPRRVALLACLLGALLVALDLGASHAPAPLSLVARRALAGSCHQDPARCFLVTGSRLPACARCVGLHAGILVGGALLAVRARRPGGAGTHGALLVLGVAPLVVDVVLGVAVTGWDHPGLRAATGAAASASILLLLVPRRAS